MKQRIFIFRGKARELTFKTLFMLWYFGRETEPLESVDFGRN